MIYFYQLILFCLLGYGLVTGKNAPTPVEVVCFLLLIVVNLLKTRYLPRKWLTQSEWLLILLFGINQPIFVIGFALLLPETLKARNRLLAGLAFLILPVLFMLDFPHILLFLIFFGVCCFFVSLIDRLQESERRFRKIADDERYYIYELEKSKRQILQQAERRTRLAELKERNRIARNLHDTIGHTIAGLYMQLQAAYKVREKNLQKSDELIEKTVAGLSDALRMVHDTAHDLIPAKTSGLERVRQLIQSFHYCELSFACSGDMKDIPERHWEIIEANVREALTNIFKHSEATKAGIELNGNRHFVRLFIHDNGKGAPVVQDHLGLNGMKERVSKMGGSLSVDGQSGFKIVCILPLTKKESGLFADSHR
ncbi:sensor histidine kinase [Sporolactobacillus sp. KGMB 08714]|uniref:sensor histidine kinase n=1 Tax=Sporolactobacillus sp. KGMB 08714 TaxID=3064704 RepID=UPI002FBDA18A